MSYDIDYNIKNSQFTSLGKQTRLLVDTLAGSIILQNSPYAINLLGPHQKWLFSFKIN